MLGVSTDIKGCFGRFSELGGLGFVRGLENSRSLNGLNGLGSCSWLDGLNVSVDCVLRCFN